MAGQLYDARVRDLLADAAEHAAAGRWDAVKALTAAALSLAPDDAEAQRLRDQAEAALPPDGERRQLTVMFCDVVGSTALSQQRDPELVGEVLRSYQATCDEVVRRYGARVHRYVGDGVLVYFGHPEVHEDDARRAVHAGLDLLEAMRPLSEEIRRRYDVDLQVRVAVHTGLVVRSDMGSPATPDRDAIVGETPNLAARLQDHARPGSLLISEATYELVRGWFLVIPAGALELRGIDRPVRAFEVVEASRTETRIEAQADLSPFVGRQDLLARLGEAWTEVAAGGSRSIVLVGAPGVGKTRLADVQRRRCDAEGGQSLVTSCSTLHASTALHPVRRLIERAAGIQGGDPRAALTRLWTMLDGLGQADALPLLADLLELPPEPWCPAPELEPALLREAVLGALVGAVRSSAARRPLLLLVDDVQWADPTTLELVGRLLVANAPGLLLVLTARDDWPVPWSAPTKLAVDRLSPAELGDLARRLPEGRDLDAEQVERAVERSDGIPLFLEELVRSSALATTGGGDERSAIPSALRDLLLARFAAPGVDLRLAQLLATIGTDVPLPVLRAASELEPATLDEQLRALLRFGILDRLDGPVPTYRFHHQLVADLAYDTQLLAARRRTHGIVADADAVAADGGTTFGPAVLAHHLEQAERFDEAVRSLATAAEACQPLGAVAEARELLEHAFELLQQVSDELGPELEFELRLLRGILEAGILGYAAPQATVDFQACRELVHRLHDPESEGYLDDERAGAASAELVWSSAGLWATFLLQGRLDDAEEVVDGLVPILRPGNPLHAYFTGMRGFSGFFRGDQRAAEVQLDGALRALERIDLPDRLGIPSDPLVAALAHRSYVHALRGQVRRSREVSDRALERARELPFPRGPFSVCYAAGMRAASELFLGDPEASAKILFEQTDLAERHGFTFWQVVSGFYHAVVAAYEGDDSAVMRAEMSITLLGSLGVEVWLPSFLASLASANLYNGQLDEAERFFDQGAAVADRIGAHYWTAEIIRQRGVLRLARGEDGALDCFRDAARLAEQQGATLLELWARTSLCEHGDDPADRAALEALVEALGDDAADLADVQAALVALDKRV